MSESMTFAPGDASVFITPVAADRATLLNAIPRIHFPWEKLLPDLRVAGKLGFTVEFADLSAFSPPPHGEPGHTHDDLSSHAEDAHGDEGHVMYGNRVPGLPEESAAAAWGLFWFDGRIQIERTLRGQQDNIDWVLSAEIAHAVDVFYAMNKAMRPKLNALVHPQPDSHPWFGGPYWDQPGESFMAGFGLAYTDFVQEDPRFLHRFTKAMAPQIRSILQAPRTDEAPPPPPPPPPPAEPTLRGATKEQFVQEYLRRYGDYAGIDIALKHRGGVDGAPVWTRGWRD